MCKFWKLEKCNHHFPELTSQLNFWAKLINITTKPIAMYVLVSTILVFGLAYLMQTNYTATKGYQIKDFEKQVSQLQDENKKMELHYAQLQSIANISSKVNDLNLVPISKIEIINHSSQVAYSK